VTIPKNGEISRNVGGEDNILFINIKNKKNYIFFKIIVKRKYQQTPLQTTTAKTGEAKTKPLCGNESAILNVPDFST